MHHGYAMGLAVSLSEAEGARGIHDAARLNLAHRSCRLDVSRAPEKMYSNAQTIDKYTREINKRDVL